MRKYVILLLILLLLALALHVSAASAREDIALGETKVTTVKPGEVADYIFTPTESGVYALCLEETGANAQNWICLEGDKQLQERYYWVAGWEGKSFELEAGKSYTFRITAEYHWADARKVRLEKVAAPTSLALQPSQKVHYPGEVLWMRPILPNPGAVGGDFQWSSSNPAVARIEDTSEIHAAVMPVAPGTATIAVSVGQLSASYELVVEPYPVVPIGGSVDVTVPVDSRVIVEIKPQQTGSYAVWCHDPGLDLTVTSAGIGTKFSSSGGRGGIYQLKAGVTYHCYLFNVTYEDRAVADTVSVEQVRPVQSLSLSSDSKSYRVGETFFVRAETDPVYAVAEGIRWSCSDPGVLRLERGDSVYEVTALKPGKATITAVIGAFSASWECEIWEEPKWQPGSTEILPDLREQAAIRTYVPREDGYYRFTVTADRDMGFSVQQNKEQYGPRICRNCHVSAGQESTLEVYLHKDVPYHIVLSGAEAGITFTGNMERMPIADKKVSRIEISSLPAGYEFGNDDYGLLIDGVYLFDPLRYQNMQGLTFTVFYADGSSATVSAQELLWGENTESGSIDCFWKDCPVEFYLLVDDIAPADSLGLAAPGTVMARLRYMGVAVDFPLEVTPGHTHQIEFVERREPTPEQDGMEAHYQCGICDKLYFDESGMDRIRDPQQLIIPYEPVDNENGFVVGEDALQDILQQLQPGERVELPVPDGIDAMLLSGDALQAFAQKGNIVQVALSWVSLQMDPQAMAAIANQAGTGQVAFHVQQVSREILQEPQRKALESYDAVCILSAEVLSGGANIHDFQGGAVTLRVPFAVRPNENYRVIYLADDGTVQEIPCQQIDNGIEFTTGHFSEYAIVRIAAESFSWVLVGVAVLLAAVGVFFAVLLKKRQKQHGKEV